MFHFVLMQIFKFFEKRMSLCVWTPAFFIFSSIFSKSKISEISKAFDETFRTLKDQVTSVLYGMQGLPGQVSGILRETLKIRFYMTPKF